MTRRHQDSLEITYDNARWELLSHFRKEAFEIMTALTSHNICSSIHGSVARGDVNSDSDIDIYIPYVVSSLKIELSLTMNGKDIHSRKIAQATPNHALKAHIYLDAEERKTVTFPLFPFSTSELEFYRFGGVVGLDDIKINVRVPGCDKRLMLIEPTEKGHIESSIEGYETEVASKIGINISTVKERIRVLNRRAKIGRTGIILSVPLLPDEVFEEVLKRLVDSNPIVRRRSMLK
jgi:predicted nucleotidyltransferase